MKALYKNHHGVTCRDIPIPVLKNEDDVVIRVKLAGLCRTDIYVANGTIKGRDSLVLGHEFSGVVEDTGASVRHVEAGDRVTVMPVIPCGQCEFCQSDQQGVCPHTTMLGIDEDGAFAEYIVVPAASVYKLPDNVSFKLGAYSEPVAASLSILKAGIKPHEKGLVYGNNRFSDLIARILQAKGFTNIDVYHPDSGVDLQENTYDFAIETFASEEIVRRIFKALKPRGRFILKSRKYDPVGVCFQQAVMKELTLTAVNYSSFEDVLELLSKETFDVDDLLGDTFSLDDFETVFAHANENETKKLFFEIG